MDSSEKGNASTSEVERYAKEHQLNAFFQKLFKKVITDMPDNPREYLCKAMEGYQPHGDIFMARQSHVYRSMSSTGAVTFEDEMGGRPHALKQRGRLIAKQVEENLAASQAASIPLRKSMQGISLEGQNISFEEPPNALGSVYLKRNTQPKAVSESFSFSKSKSAASQKPQPSYAAPVRTVSRSHSKERLQQAKSNVEPTVAKPSKIETGFHKVAPLMLPRSPQPETEHIDTTAAVAAPGRKKKLFIKEEKRKHREELLNFIDIANTNVDKDGNLIDNKGPTDTETEKLLSKCRKGFGVSQYMKSLNPEEGDSNELERQRERKPRSKNKVVMFDRNGDTVEDISMPPEYSSVKASRSSKKKIPKELFNTGNRRPVALQTGKSAWDESSTPVSPTTTETTKVEEFFTEKSAAASKSGHRFSQPSQACWDEADDAPVRPWLKKSASNKSSSKNTRERKGNASPPSAALPIGEPTRSRTSSASSISDIFASGTKPRRF